MSAKFPRGGEQGLFWPAVYGLFNSIPSIFRIVLFSWKTMNILHIKFSVVFMQVSECSRSGKVCGHNGETYENECAALADRTTIDYIGPCRTFGLISGNITCLCLASHFWRRPIFSSPEPKADKVSLWYTNGPSSVCRHRPSSSSTLSNLNISEARWPMLIKFYV